MGKNRLILVYVYDIKIKTVLGVLNNTRMDICNGTGTPYKKNIKDLTKLKQLQHLLEFISF